ncbi:hypothetical protein OHA84_01820 [Streptomyces sp. NBC_00513]|uniref:hypothetical protein n=1 Tax=unclassified Streptomyces TaxID=2593676 RepID=UPI0022563EB7|nr:hypothetical protein [Streptomyces sp. NBC_00424]MCX5079099.1 hypothetical protein [Streptomyces sp. NBC_00424]WUD39335.1 hypothetical protein OHA84_01820 [Streptomyces sp. NBC_00513]
MDALVFNVTTAVLMVLMFKAGVALLGEGTLRGRRMPWAAVVLTGLALTGTVVQVCWSGAMDALDADPARSGWWRVLTSVFMQNGGLFGGAWNIATLAVIAALADWFWRTPITVGLFLAGILLPEHIDTLFGAGGHHSTDPRNFAGSSGATYFLGATLAAALLLRLLRELPTSRTGLDKAQRVEILFAVGVPVLGLVMWFAQANGHGLVSVYGFVLGALTCLVARPAAFRTRPTYPASKNTAH